MRKNQLLSTLVTIIVIFLPAKVFAVDPPALDFSPIIITEIQTGATSASNEFVELYNTTDSSVDIAGWQLRYQKTSSTTLFVTIGDSSGQTLISPHGYFVVQTPEITADDSAQQQIYIHAGSKSITSTDQTLGLYAPDATTCQMKVRDAVAWGSALQGEGTSVLVQDKSERLLQRYVDAGGNYVDTNNNFHDFQVQNVVATGSPLAEGATPGDANGVSIPDWPNNWPPFAGSNSTMPDVGIKQCTVPAAVTVPTTVDESTTTSVDNNTPEVPATPVDPNAGLAPPQITELLPNPGAPRTDSSDEFVEIYNPNDTAFDLSGYVLKTGSSFTFPNESLLQPKSYTSFFSADINISLANTSGQASLYDQQNNLVSQTQTYTNAKDDQAWIWLEGQWQWSLEPTPNAQNVLKIATPKPVIVSTATKKPAIKKVTAVKGASTKKTGMSSPVNQVATLSTTQSLNPLHPRVLALIGGFAILYGAYEYRRDIANKINQLQTDRANRRNNRS